MSLLGIPRVSVIIPVRNESEFIGECLDRLFGQTYPLERLEILVMDGMSTDRTREIVEHFRQRRLMVESSGTAFEHGSCGGTPDRPVVRVIDNPKGQRAPALNLGVMNASGEVIVRLDARTVVSPNYIEKCVRTLVETGADNVGGIQRPLALTPTQEAIGLAMSHPFGIGNARFRLGGESGPVDTVYPGCFRRDVFDRVGLFDEDPRVISEDSDLNFRIRRAGGRIYLNSEISVYYRPRQTLADLWKLYFHYGSARAVSVLKYGVLFSWRQFVPPIFVGVLGVLTFSTIIWPIARFLLLLALGAYVLVDLVVSMLLSIRWQKIELLLTLPLVFPCMHLAWGLGFWSRIFLPRRLKPFWGL